MSRLHRLRRTVSDSSEARVEIAPLIDVVFLLLIFFVITTTFVQPTAVPIDRPTVRQATPLPERPLIVTITASGETWMGEKPWGVEDTGAMRSALSAREGGRVLVHADGDVPTRELARVIDACRAAGASRVDLAADRGGAQ